MRKMSRIGKVPVKIPEKVKVDIEKGIIKISKDKKELTYRIPEKIGIKKKDGEIKVERKEESRKSRALQGLARTLVSNMVEGVTNGFMKKLELVGRGKRAKVQGKKLILEIGLSHPYEYNIPEGIEVNIQKNIIEISGVDKQKVGETAAEIRDIQPPEPYKGSGIRYHGEHIRKKAGKAAVGGGFTGAGQ